MHKVPIKISSGSSRHFCVFHILINLFFFVDSQRYSCNAQSIVNVGVVLDQNSSLGSMANLCMQMALSEFYLAHPNYKTRLQFHTRDAQNVLDANLAVLDLLKQEEVHGIIGPQGPTQEEFLSTLGEKVHVPIISFTARTSSLPYNKNSYIVRTTQDDAVQARALATICQGFHWPQVIVLYENTEYGNQFLSHLNTAFQDFEIGLAYVIAFPASSEDSYLLAQLKKLSTKQTKVYIVHMSPSLGWRLFGLAKIEGMTSEGYAWIITDSLSIFMNSMDSVTRDSMQGVLGIRPYVLVTKSLESFQERWKRNMFSKMNTSSIMELNIYGLWAYDTVIALANASEKTGGLINSTNLSPINGTNLRTSTFGPVLLSELSSINLEGLSGSFRLIDGKLKPSAFEIFNVIGSGERRVGFWSPDRGLTRDLSFSGEAKFSSSSKELKKVIWPGDSVAQPKGWSIPPTGKLRVGIPWKPGFKQFVNASIDPITKQVLATGFSIDIFLAALPWVPFPINYEFHVYNDTQNINWSYNDMLKKIPQEYDMVVADTTIWAPRASYVDFSLPYSESGVVLVVKNKKPHNMLIFIKPFEWNLWLAIIFACILLGAVLYKLEHRAAITEEEDSGNRQIDRLHRAFLPVTFVVIPERNLVSNKSSFFILLCWVFMVYILMQSFTANLSAILTVDQINFSFSDKYYLGYKAGSFMKQFLIEKMHIDPSKLRSYNSEEEYHEAMSKGSKNGGVDAIFDEGPYMKLFMNKYDSQYKIMEPRYRTDGFGFAFPIGSPLVAYFSRAILNVTQGPGMTSIEQKNFGPGYSSQDPLSSTISQGTASLTLYQFLGLFLVVGVLTIIAVACSLFSETEIGQKFIAMIGNVTEKIFGPTVLQVHPDGPENNNVIGDEPPGEEGRDSQDDEEISETGPNVNEAVVQDVGDGELMITG